MRVLILGATGFIGRNMVERFVARGDEVHAVWHERPSYEMAGVTWHRADMLQPFDFNGFDVVIQAAATTSGSADIVNNPAIHVTDNAIMNSLIFKAAVEAEVKHVIFFSCTVMYASGSIPVRETHFDANALIENKYYGVAHTKLYCEKLCKFYSGLGDTKFTAIRHSNIYGPYDKFDLKRSHVFGATITKVMLALDNITVWGRGDEARDLLHVSDLCDFVELAIQKQPEKFGLYNCGSGIAVKINDLVHKIIAASGKPLVIEHDLTAPTIPTSLCLNYEKAYDELGWHPQIPLDEGIERTIEWWAKGKNPDNYKIRNSYSDFPRVLQAIDMYQAYTHYKDFKDFDKKQALGFKDALLKSRKSVSIADVHFTMQALKHLRGFFASLGIDASCLSLVDEEPDTTKVKEYRRVLTKIAAEMEDK